MSCDELYSMIVIWLFLALKKRWLKKLYNVLYMLSDFGEKRGFENDGIV